MQISHIFFLFPENSDKLITATNGQVLYDVHTGSGYKEIVPPGYGGIIFNTDGISPFKSSRITVWPILIALPKHQY